MVNKTKSQKKSSVIQINLPGEPIQCWAPNIEKLQVLLAKHRDVIFDIQLFPRMRYEVEADQDSIYDTRIKQLIPPKNKIIFDDGELLHLWIGRGFTGKLKLIANGKILGIISPQSTGVGIESDDPAVKPAPISIVLKNSQAIPAYHPFHIIQLDGSFTSPSKEVLLEAEKFLQIIEIDPSKEGTPKEIADFFKKGGEKDVFESGGVATRNWIMNQVIAQSAYLSDNKSWIVELWDKKITLKTIVHRNAGKKMYVILTGSTRVRRSLAASIYSANNSKVLAFSFGARSAAGLRHAGWGAVTANFAKAGLCSMLFTVTLDIAEWITDYEEIDSSTGKSKQNITDLFIKIGLDISKNLLNSMVGTALMWAAVTLAGGAPILVIIVGTILMGIAVSYVVDVIDKKYGDSENIGKIIKKSIDKLQDKQPLDYKNYGNALGQSVIMGGMGA